ncbi:MAG: dTDP-4-dehydrorhamnose reductase [Acidobacteria bacterium]|nr:MAG: dTDP-4-dehydrorhamnose reductase [Acidobacteriota bacterium]
MTSDTAPPGGTTRPLRPLILGAGGLVGSALGEYFERRYPDTVSATRVELDITDRWRLEAELERLQPNVVINAAALADVDRCEADPLAARRINEEGPANLAAACAGARCKVVHISTDYVFDGNARREYDEADPPNPINVYGVTKLRGEMAVLERLPDALVVRTSFVFGPGRPTFADRILEALRRGERVRAVPQWINKPTHTGEIAAGVERLLLAGETGLWHVASSPAVDKLTFARKVAELAGFDPGSIEAVPPEALGLRAPRPLRTPLSTARYEARFGPVLGGWEAALAAHLAAR